MKYEYIIKIWEGYVQSEEYQRAAEFRYGISREDMERFERELGKKIYMDIESVAMSLGCEAELCGFIQGFKMATQLMCECFLEKEGVTV